MSALFFSTLYSVRVPEHSHAIRSARARDFSRFSFSSSKSRLLISPRGNSSSHPDGDCQTEPEKYLLLL
ncbi:hypothetical protein KSP40_PGU005851 [Platanthera guangdongensis]|uniref:Uncharacterized protein n=1 Tax=Platanthera guangdongensis TaxID=2320717 RepID=A0ABR2LE40_9ASPA